MVFEHFALNVADVAATVAWYGTHLGVKVRWAQAVPPFMTFLEDGSGRVFMELYQREDEARTDFSLQHPLTFHLAFVSEDALADAQRLMAEGASLVEKVEPDDGSRIMMLRDPWGLPLQLCQRAKKF